MEIDVAWTSFMVTAIFVALCASALLNFWGIPYERTFGSALFGTCLGQGIGKWFISWNTHRKNVKCEQRTQ